MFIFIFGGAMPTETPSTKPSKSEQTRERILDAALVLFADKGYTATTLRDIAAASGSSLGLTYRYFGRKEELVLALYQRLARELEEEVQALPPAPMADRFAQVTALKLERLAPYRQALGALFGVALAPDSEVAVLGAPMSEVRERIWRVFHAVVRGATDAPGEPQARQLTSVLYAAHLALVLFWMQDRSDDQNATRSLLALAREILGRLRLLLRLPFTGRWLARLGEILGPMFGGVPAATDESFAQIVESGHAPLSPRARS
jgi:AcrR family transcriptional regulator